MEYRGIGLPRSLCAPPHSHTGGFVELVLANLSTVLTVAAILIVLLSYKWVLWLFGVIIVPDDSVGIVTKKFVLFGANKSLPDGRIIEFTRSHYRGDSYDFVAELTIAPGVKS